MPAFIRTVFLGHDISLWLPEPNWAASPEISYSIAAQVEQALSGRQNRRPKHLAIRHEITAKWTLPREDAAAWNEGSFALGAALVAIPIPCDQLAPADWHDRIHSAEFVLARDNVGGFQIVASSAVQSLNPSAFSSFAPLFVGRLTEQPAITALNDWESQFSLTLAEQSPWDFRIAPAPAAAPIGPDWPGTLSANWRTLPETAVADSLETDEVGSGRPAAIDGQEGQPRRTQNFLVTLDGREQIRTLLKFFESRLGPVRSWTVPWLLRPSEADTHATPHATRVRFAKESITLKYITDELAEASIEVEQLPWEIALPAGEQPELEPEAHFFRFTAAVPGGLDWRFTNWEHDIVRTEGGAPVTYRGDAHSFFEYDQITRTIDLSDDPITLASWVFDGNPLMLVIQRALDAPLRLEIRKGSPANPDAARLIYAGDIEEVTAEGRRLSATTTVLGGLLEVKAPNFYFGPVCNHGFCRPGCYLDPARWTFSATIEAIDGNTIDIAITVNPSPLTPSTGFFTRGWLGKGAGIDYELRNITQSVALGGNRHRLTLRRPLRVAQPGLALTVMPHCSGTKVECDRYDNYINFGGHPHIGSKNLSLPTREAGVAGGKK